jgi:CrcB protein
VPRSPTSATSNRRPNRPRRHPGDLVAVAMGGLIGSALRAGIGVLLPTPSGGFPTGTLVVNLSGSFLLGLYLVRREQAATPRWSLPFWALGLLGSFTTFSAFSLEVTVLVGDGHALTAALYSAASTVGGLAAALVGQRVGSVLR